MLTVVGAGTGGPVTVMWTREPAVKVTFITPHYAPSPGGAQALVRSVAEGLARDYGHQVEVLTTDEMVAPSKAGGGPIAVRREVLDGVTIRRYRYGRRLARLTRRLHLIRRRLNPHGRPRRPGPLRTGPLGLRLHFGAWLACRRSDVVIVCPVTTALTLAVAAATARRARRIALPLVHHQDGRPQNRSAAWSLRRFDAVVVLTEFERTVVEALGVDCSAIEVLPPGCDPGPPSMTAAVAREQVGLPARPTIGFVGRFTSYKGVDTILEAAPRLFEIYPDLTILLAGAPQGWRRFESLHRELAPLAGDRLVVRERFPESDKALLLAACDVVLCPSREESFGMVNLEAWAAKRPVVSGDIPAVRSFVRPGIDALLIRPGEADELVDAVGSLLDDHDRARRIGAAGHARLVKEFAWTRIIERWESLLSDQVEGTAESSRSGGDYRGDPLVDPPQFTPADDDARCQDILAQPN